MFKNMGKYDNNQKCVLSMSIANTTCIRGVAILAVILHHYSQYYAVPLCLFRILDHFGYLAVGTFLFLSGYGNFVSYNKKPMNKKDTWVWGIKRVLGVAISFVIIYLLSYLFIRFWVPSLEYSFSWKDILTLTLPTWTNWYLKVQIGLYILFTVLALIIPKDRIRLIIFLMLVCIYVFLGRRFGLANFWWNSILCYPMGMFVAKYKNVIDNLKTKIWIALACFVLFFIFTYLKQMNNLFGICACICFVTVVYFINEKRPLQGKIFAYFGKYSLEIYMVHLVVMRVLLAYAVNMYAALLLIMVISISISIGINKLSAISMKMVL